MEDGVDDQGRKKFREVSLRTANKKEAFDKWHEMQAHHSEVTFTTPVDVLLTQFLDDCKKRRTKATYQQYSVAILSFQNWLKEHAPKLRVSDLRRKHLMDWAGECFPLARDGQEGYARDTVRG